MSRYKEKRERRPGCRVFHCQQPGTVLAIREGVLGWYCEDHDNREKKL